ncbi:unnamed protein product [Anisakis simplex]|uniref:Glyco_hydro_38C domain-containing protein n=1 Tax=Anisakis simplex TaxID=6269 RepID=A0A0M3JZR0_ANISI|nr:unnamed protein product [Anisakis simplex]
MKKRIVPPQLQLQERMNHKQTTTVRIQFEEYSLTWMVNNYNNQSSVRNAIIDLPLKEHMRKSRNIIHSMQTMFIMAYLGPLDRHRESCDVKDEHIICKITSIDGTMIIFEPKGVLDAGIRIESRYGIYNATVTVDDIKFDQLSMIERDQDLDWMHKGDGSDTNSNTFDITDEGITKIDYLLQIGNNSHNDDNNKYKDDNRALNFVHDGLYVEYRIELPPGNGGVTEAVNTGVDVQYEDSIRTIISGKTQICCTKTYEKDDVASFAHLIRFSSHLETKPSELIGNEYDNNSTDENWLLHHQEARLLVRICAESDWGRYYVDGYGMLMLPITPGRHHLTINCWRPVDRNNRHAKLKERFVAQASDLINSDHLFSFRNNDNKWSRIGLTTEGSGQLEVICDCIVQSRQFISSTHLQHLKYGTMMNRIGLHSNLHWRILKALMDFEEAKKHLLKVRSEQPVPKLNFNL